MSLTIVASTYETDTRPQPARTGAALVLGATVGLIAWELFARGIAPVWTGGPLQPTELIRGLFANALGWPVGSATALALHLVTGLLAYPAVFYLLTRAHSFGWAADGLLWGVATWFLALGVIAPWAGLPFLLDVGAVTWAALAGHLLYGLGAAGGFAVLARWLA